MLNLTEVDRSVLTGVACGFFGSVSYAVVDTLLEKLIKNEAINITVTFVLDRIAASFGIAVFWGVAVFSLLSINAIATDAVNRSLLSFAIGQGFLSPVFFNLYEYASSNLFRQD
jgi:hypothetical protein